MTHLAGTATEGFAAIRCAAAEILSEAGFAVVDPASAIRQGEGEHDSVYCLDYRWTLNADLAFFLALQPSHGVGIESQVAANAAMPRVIAYPRGTRVSRMFLGTPSRTLLHLEYQDLANFRSQLREAVPGLINTVRESAGLRRPVLEAITSARLGKRILEERILRNISLEVLAASTDITASWLARIERHDELAGCLSLVGFMRLADSLNCDIKVGDPRLQLVGEQQRLTTLFSRSLENLVTFVRSSDEWIDDGRVRRMWREYSDEVGGLIRNGAAKFRNPIVDIAEWRSRYSGRLL